MINDSTISIGKSAIDLTGRTFGYLTALYPVARTSTGMLKWSFVCACGNTVVRLAKNVTSGGTKSCGCYKAKIIKDRCGTHGLTGTRIYRIWHDMKVRCYDPTSPSFKYYGMKGIEVCDRWRNSFSAFFEDMGQPTSSTHQLDRKASSGNYCADNCKWSTPKQNARNTSKNVFVSAHGLRFCISEWAERTGIKASIIGERIRYGWSETDAVTIPPKKYKDTA